MADVMTPKERIEAVIGLEQPDRVPVAPMPIYFNAHVNGISSKEFLRNMVRQVEVTERTFERMGGWDAWYFAPGGTNWKTLKIRFPLQILTPGDGLPDDAPLPQLDEKEVMAVGDYDVVINDGYDAWYAAYLRRLYPDENLDVIFTQYAPAASKALAAFHRKWEVERKVPLLYGVSIFQPVEIFSFARSFYQFALDLARRPEKVTQACDAALEPVLQRAINGCKNMGLTALWVGGWRTGATFISPRQFERFVLPGLKKIVNELVANDLTPVLHFDANWTPFLRFLRELPPKKCILATDQETDLFEAKKVLGDHMCLLGNVHPHTLALGTVDDVVAECRRLIDIVGAGGGFILSSGCEVPFNARPENVQAMVDTAKTYGVYQK
ncbi:MAG: uroporphyrinogen-III decarboxylase [Chloroflexi bacterium]|nr:uroporphyrinogen-III decarboxylase [Chloroflexota bacterium]MDA8189851.1 hypothetical protein [Dehalococcoidales bacterium]